MRFLLKYIINFNFSKIFLDKLNRIIYPTVSQFLSTATESSFLIPEYQRRYSWTEDEAETLFNDIWEFTLKEGIDTGNTYFLGSIIFYKNNGKQEIIDGQQRITSIFLLLRAIYTKLEGMSSEAKEAKNFMNQISNIIWKYF